MQPTELLERLMNAAHYNERSEKLIFFRDNLARMYKANIVAVAHETVQRWNFEWPHMNKEEFKKRLKSINEINVL